MNFHPLHFFTRTIHGRLVVVASIPLILITSLLTAYAIHSQRSEVMQTLYGSGHSATNYLVTISDFALYSGNRELLSSLAISTQEIPAVSGVSYLDADRSPLVSTANFPFDEDFIRYPLRNMPVEWGRYLLFERPVYLSGVAISDYREESQVSNPGRIIGWVLVAVDQSESFHKLDVILYSNLGIGAVILLAALLLSYYLSRSLVAPVKQVTDTVRRLQQGDLLARIEPRTRDELASLAEGINHLAESVAQSRQNLELKVYQATRQLQTTLQDLQTKNTELETARQEAEAANQSKSEFLARMSHELRTPITAIRGFVRLLYDSSLPDPEKRYCSIIDQASEQLLSLIDDILGISRLQSGASELENAPLDLAECIENPVCLIAPNAHNKGVELVLDIEPDVPLALVGDSLRIQQIVSNLVSNAVKFTAEGYVLVRVSTDDPEADRAEISIKVLDTGIGIPESERREIFKAFAQADTSISRRFGGTGLGLAIVKSLVDLMGGRLALESTEEGGTCFTATLPLPRQPDEAAITPEDLHILVIDPIAPSRRALGHLFERICNRVTLRSSPRSTPDDKVDVAVFVEPVRYSADERYGVLSEIRQQFSIPILMISPLESLHQSFTAEQMQELQPIHFTNKPPGLHDLQAALSLRVEGRHTVDHGEAPLQGLSILIAEDNEFNCLLLSTLLSQAGAECSFAHNGLETVNAARLHEFDLFLIDVHMPEISGIEAVSRIRDSNTGNRDKPVLMLTADVLQTERDALFKAGADELLYKPIDETRLLSTILRLTGREVEGQPLSGYGGSDIPREEFFAEVRKLVNCARTAFEEKDQRALREQIHQLLGIAGVFKMRDLEDITRNLHAAVKNGETDRSAVILDNLAAEVDALMESPITS